MLKAFDPVARREWFGLFALTAWYFSVYQSYDPTLYARSMNMFWFSLALAVPMIALGAVCGDNIGAVARIARFSAPVGLACTVVMPLLPPPGFVALFVISPVFIAPLILRCCYGVVTSAGEKWKLTAFMTAITAAIFAHALWLFLARTLMFPPFGQFLFPAAAGLMSYAAIAWREPPVCEPSTRAGAFLFLQTRYVVLAAVIFLLVCAFDLASDLFHSYFLAEGLRGDPLLFAGGALLPAVSLSVYALFTDRLREKQAMIVGFSLYLLGLILALLRQGEPDLLPALIIADGVGGAYSDFFVVGFSIMFFSRTDKPVLMASLGMALDILTASSLWAFESLAPVFFPGETLSAGHIAVMAALVILLLAAALLIVDTRSEKTFVASLLSALFREPETTEGDPALAALDQPGMAGAGLLAIEQTIAALFIDGLTRHDIARRLHISPAEMEVHQKNILNKIRTAAESGTDALVAKAVHTYGIRQRQAQILSGVLRGMSNARIAETCQITERTVKYHMAELFAKTGTKNRRELTARLRGDE
ncbi:MAG: helix-turn-helix transcriptional regulator [Gracilibacteraceae bacterium]|jgi:DNA-binding NarL/FixJ family response regulator|nr:helix-turn-helix transcriptional regulator [Gracilibacteraceae bacterium]